MVDKDLYFFDCFGLYHKKNVFLDSEIKKANKFFDDSKEKTNKGMKFYNVFDQNEVFIDFINHEEVIKICKVCFGDEFRLDHAFIINQNPSFKIKKGLHGKCFGKNMSHYYISSPQMHLESPCFTRTGQLSVGIVLKPQNKTTGGFCYIPGSHKTSYCVSGQNVHTIFLSKDNDFNENVIVPELNPGDLIAMPECLVHGQTEMNSGERRIVYNMFFPLGNKFMDFSKEYQNINKIISNKEKMKYLTDTPTNMLTTKTSVSDISLYKPKKFIL